MSAQSLQSALKKLEKLDEFAKGIEHKRVENNNRVYEAVENVRKQELSVRITEVTPMAIKLREKVLKNKTILRILKDCKLSIGEVGLILCRSEGVRRHFFRSGPKTTIYFRQDHLLNTKKNEWMIGVRYVFGGPGDKIRVFFDNAAPESIDLRRYHIRGFMTNFPLR